MSKSNKLLVVWADMPNQIMFFSVEDKELDRIFRACHNKFINQVCTNSVQKKLDELCSVMYGEDGCTRDPRIVPVDKAKPLNVDGVTVVLTGFLS